MSERVMSERELDARVAHDRDRDPDDEAECAYCFALVPAAAEDEGPPEPSEHRAWARIADDHAPDCEWVRTRAHRLPGEPEEPA